MHRHTLAAATLLIATAAPAADFEGQDIWGGITYGMSRADAKLLYPKFRTQLTDKCQAWIELTSERKKVQAVQLTSPGLHEDEGDQECGGVLAVSLRAKYGAPSASKHWTEHKRANCRGGFLCALAEMGDRDIEWERIQWFTGSMMVTYEWQTDENKWSIHYSPATAVEADKGVTDKI